MSRNKTTATYITWDGPAQNYLESLFLPIFDRAQGSDLDFTVLQFTWGDPAIRDSIAETAASMDIPYEAHEVWRKPLKPATAAMIAYGAARIIRHAKQHGTTTLVPRSIIPAAMTFLARQQLPHIDIIYDSDGFMADERVEFEGWNGQGAVYRLFREVEAHIGRIANRVVTRSHRGATIIRDRIGPLTDPDKIYVVPNGKDPELFSPGNHEQRLRTRQRLGIPKDAPFVIYAGSLSPRYLPEAIFKFFSHVYRRKSTSRLVILTGHQESARQYLAESQVPQEAVLIDRVKPSAVATHLAAADLGISFREPSFSQQGVSPIKIAEYLLCGLPVLATPGVGDVATQIDDGVGIICHETTDKAIAHAVEQFFDRILKDRTNYRHQCRHKGLAQFSLQRAAEGYRDALGLNSRDKATSESLPTFATNKKETQSG